MREDLTAAMSVAAWWALLEVYAQVWHRMELCDGQFRLFRKGAVSCKVCLDEKEAAEQAVYFEAWDRIGLGYIGPRGRMA